MAGGVKGRRMAIQIQGLHDPTGWVEWLAYKSEHRQPPCLRRPQTSLPSAHMPGKAFHSRQDSSETPARCPDESAWTRGDPSR